MENIKAIACVDPVLSKIDSLQQELKQPLEPSPEKGQPSPGQVFLSMKDPGVVLKDIGVVFQKLDPSKWATAELTFKITDAGPKPSAEEKPPVSPPEKKTFSRSETTSATTWAKAFYRGKTARVPSRSKTF